MKRRVLGLLLFLLVVPLFMGCDQTTTQTTQATTQTTTTVEVALGTVTFEVYTKGDNPATEDVTETEYVSKTLDVEYFEGDTLFDLLEANLTFGYSSSDFGRYVISIETIVPVSDNNEYVAFYIDGAYANTGIDDTPLTDGAVYGFKLGSF